MNKYPNGKLIGSDKGSVTFALEQKDGNVILDFGRSVTWLEMPPQRAEQLADMLKKHATAIRNIEIAKFN